MARLTKAQNPTQLTVADKRRHTDPPTLWLAVATGSVVFHLLLAVIILPLQARLSGNQTQLDPVPIDFVEIDAAEINAVEIAPTEASVAIVPNPTQPDSATAQQPASPQAIETFPTPPPEPEPIPEPEPTSEAELEPPSEEPIPAPVPSAPAELEQSADETAPSAADPPPDETASNSGDSSTTDNSAEGTAPDNSSNTASAGGNSGLPEVSVDSTANSVGWATSVVVSLRPDRTVDVPNQLASIKPGRDRLPEPTSFGCPVEPEMEGLTEQEQYAQYLAEAAPYLSTPVNVNVTVEAGGQVSDAYVSGATSGSYAYDQLAVCLIQNWLEFNPALREGVPWASDNQQVTIIINSSG